MEKSANKRWKESGTTLSFKDWINRENTKNKPEGNFIPFSPEPSSVAQDTINETLRRETESILKTAGFRKDAEYNKNKVFGLDKGVLIFSTLLVVGSVGFYFYGKMKKKQ